MDPKILTIILLAFFFVLLVIVNNLYKNYKKGCRITFPAKVLMRKDYLKNLIPVLNQITKTSKGIRLDFSQIEELTHGSLMVIWAQVEKAIIKKPKRKIDIFPYLPPSKKVVSILKAGQNYKHKNITFRSISENTNAIIKKNVDTMFVDSTVAELKNMGFKMYYTPFYDFLIEIIGNATEHGIMNKNINWWMLKYLMHGPKRMVYVFVDMGLGIIESYKKSKIISAKDKDHPEMVILNALNGRLGSSTKMDGRGRGLPQIKEIVEKQFISNFVLITNNVSLRYIDGEFEFGTNPNFIGTYFSWTIEYKNYNTWKDSQLR